MLKPSLDDLIKSSVRSILKNKGRTILTSLGIIIGVTSVILLTSIGNGLKGYISDQFESLGSNTIFIAPGKIFDDKGGFSNSSGPSSRFIFTTFSQSDVIVLGYSLANDLFPNGSALNKKIVVKSKNMKIIGILDKKGGSFGGPDVDQYAFTPLGNVFDFNGTQNINQILIKTPSKDLVPQVKIEAKNAMLKKFNKDAFTVFDSSQLLSSINTIIGTLTVALAGIAAISLVVGGIGIMNIMLVTVSERTREIGLRKAIGAYPSAILIQFLIEAIILSSIGGFIGILLGSLGASAINNFFPARVTISSILIAFGVSALVGIIFGVAPARRASRLSPIEALRYE